LCLAGSVVANVEKVIFVAPSVVAKQNIHAGVNDLDVTQLTPIKSSIRFRTPVVFSNSTHEKGLQSWYLLNDLKPDGRYEVRVCWAAIVSFHMSLNQHRISLAKSRY